MRGNKAFRDTQRKVIAPVRKRADEIMTKSPVARAYYDAVLTAAEEHQRRTRGYVVVSPQAFEDE